MTDANWAGELEGLRSTSCGWIYLGDHLLETYSSTQQIVALSTAESECISITKGAAHALEVRSAMVVFGMTFNVVCETDASAGRAMATIRGAGRVTWMRDCCGCSSCAQKAWFKFEPGLGVQRGRLGTKMVDLIGFERNTPSTANGLELMDGAGDSPRGCRGSKRLPCTNLEREEHVRDEWLVLDLCGNGHCGPDGVVGRTACECHFR